MYKYNRSSRALPLAREENFLIIGLGVDIAEVPRIKAAIERRGQPFLRRVFTPNEIEYCERFKNKFERYAGRFAAKEATMKALGTGWNRNVGWSEIEVVRERGKRPTIVLSGKAAEFAQRKKISVFHLSITHTAKEAIAHVIAES
jgi:holo-[acyl-carrier protein] synthase